MDDIKTAEDHAFLASAEWQKEQDKKPQYENEDEFAKGVLRGAAINLITWIDYNAAEGNMCLSNMECKDIEDALVSSDWDKIYAYIKKKLEKQGERPKGKSALEAAKSPKQEWSEEDFSYIDELTDFFEHCGELHQPQENVVKWLKSLKERLI